MLTSFTRLFRSRSNRRAARRPMTARKSPPRLEVLEDRQVLATFTVTNVNDAGPGSLRQAILDANSTSAADLIVFRIGSGPQTIQPRAELPAITQPVDIDGRTQPGFSGIPLITLNGTFVQLPDLQTVGGLTITSGNSVVRSLAINRFRANGIAISGGGLNTIVGCHLGVDRAGTVANGNSRDGVSIVSSASNSLVGNVISGNGSSGVDILGSGARRNVLHGNLIGTNVSGTGALRNGSSGVTIGGDGYNLIGGAASGQPNLISGNSYFGIYIVSGSNNAVQGNHIGTNAAGTAALANDFSGIALGWTTFNTIGGLAPGQGNVISGNRRDGILLSGPGNSHNNVWGNFIGTKHDGFGVIPNGNEGVEISDGATYNLIGGNSSEARNVISGNNGNGISIFGSSFNTVKANYIGTNAFGPFIPGNSVGVFIDGGSTSNVVGGSTAGERNVISGNLNSGVVISGNGTNDNIVRGNHIGTNAGGTAALGNSAGVLIIGGASGNVVGGLAAGDRNLISGNRGAGVVIGHAGTSFNEVLGNYVGTDAAGTGALGNGDAGVRFSVGATVNRMFSNVIAFNTRSGVQVGLNAGDASTGNAVRINSIFANGALGIDLGGDGVTSNDGDDADAGPNNLQNYPVLTSAVAGGAGTTVTGILQSTPNTRFTLDFYVSSALDPSGFGEGERFLSNPGVATDATGQAAFTITLPATTPGQFLTATATDPDGNTSEFSAGIEITAASSGPGPGGDAARALSAAEASRTAPLVSLPSHERPTAEATTRQAGGVAPPDRRPDGAAVDAYFGEPSPRRRAAAAPSEDGSRFWERGFIPDES